jgi:hypothetical protein
MQGPVDYTKYEAIFSGEFQCELLSDGSAKMKPQPNVVYVSERDKNAEFRRTTKTHVAESASANDIKTLLPIVCSAESLLAAAGASLRINTDRFVFGSKTLASGYGLKAVSRASIIYRAPRPVPMPKFSIRAFSSSRIEAMSVSAATCHIFVRGKSQVTIRLIAHPSLPSLVSLLVYDYTCSVDLELIGDFELNVETPTTDNLTIAGSTNTANKMQITSNHVSNACDIEQVRSVFTTRDYKYDSTRCRASQRTPAKRKMDHSKSHQTTKRRCASRKMIM